MARLLVLLPLVAACHQYRVVSFDVEPHLGCPGQSVQVSWNVEGRARLAIIEGTKAPTPDQVLAAERPVKSRDTETLPLDETTTFVIRAVDANQAKDPWQGMKWIEVPTSDESKGVTTECDGTTCRGTFTIHASGDAARVTHISTPTLKQNGTQVPATIRITHGALVATPLEPGHDLSTVVPAAGEWTLEATLPARAPDDPPPGLGITLHIACP